MGHEICFYGEIWLIIPNISLLPLFICGMCKSISYIFLQVSLLKSVEEENKKKRGATGEGGGPEAKKPMSK